MMGLLVSLSAFQATPALAQERWEDILKKMQESEQFLKDNQKAQALQTDAPIFIELYTAADCSACVLADRLLYEASKTKNVIALSCYISDLNAIGGEPGGGAEETPIDGTAGQSQVQRPMDPCVLRQWTYRNKAYTSTTKIDAPRFIFNGEHQLQSGNFDAFDKILQFHHYSNWNTVQPVLMQWKDKTTISLHLPYNEKRLKDGDSASIWIIRYKDMEVKKIDEGINQGRVLRFSNIIQSITHVGKWRGDIRALDLKVPAPAGGKEKGGYAIVVQETMGMPVVAAGQLADYPLPNDVQSRPVPSTDALHQALPQDRANNKKIAKPE